MKPSILTVIGERIKLRKVGKEHLGCCPFHPDKNPSFSVNEEKGLFHCFACGESGDVFDFIMRLDSCSFTEAAKSLGVGTDKLKQSYKRPSEEAVAVTTWANAQFLRAQSILREIKLAQELSWREEIDRLMREFQILSIVSDDLQTPRYAIALYRDPEQKFWVEKILANAPPEEPPEFTTLTHEYKERLKSYVKG